ncbi:MAG TPA: bifunctional diaminohydroxyphosphoribosylaminopyrimidine deaminase/5-amino-6-(5-phosphoribosylamino)uracil reductase RibD [Thermodesulfobacteriota bacterium]|nr:bifunctional diaminohydroxyphosphoribosylaminopyrimidine deaminase/5-amino-6-(5-phosphoribosylamino)uracil reductase RibD [Thermodesulfobacteriota bacterium]
MSKDLDLRYMSLALRLAKKAEGMTSPNPHVGAVVVKNGEIIGKGYHKKAGLPHAEIEAFLDAERKGHSIDGAALYVTLEPCCHTAKRTPPCVNEILQKRVSKVVVGTLDLNPAVSGNGVKALKEKGIKVKVGVLEEKCREINESFFKYVATKKPFVVLKLAATLDGKIATFTGDSKWIGSEIQRKRAHQLRNKVDAVLVGIGTVIRDNPQLTVRLGKKSDRQPTPVVLDSKLRIPLDAQLLQIHEFPIIATTPLADTRKVGELEIMGAKVLMVDSEENGRVDIEKLMTKLGEEGITSVLVEGGSEIAASFLKKELVDKVIFFYAPKIVGADGVSMIGRLGISKISDTLPIKRVQVKTLGEELIIEGYMK